MENVSKLRKEAAAATLSHNGDENERVKEKSFEFFRCWAILDWEYFYGIEDAKSLDPDSNSTIDGRLTAHTHKTHHPSQELQVSQAETSFQLSWHVRNRFSI